MRATVDSILTDDPPVPGKPYGALVEDNDGRMVSFWIAVVPGDDAALPSVAGRCQRCGSCAGSDCAC